ncbi:MAG: hypothetical protein ACI8T1_000694 [Verrucomicrobiales bacterium]|jgi:hypothetical protein
MAEAMAHWLKRSLQEPKRIHLWGNHDLAYAFPNNRHLRCSGFTEEKCAIIRNILTAEDWSRLRLLHHEAPNFIFTHAGIDPKIFEHPIAGLTVDRMKTRCDEALANAQAGLRDPVLDLSGVTWLRWWEMEHLEHFHQIVGHTPDPNIQVSKGETSFNVCLDTFGNYVGMLTDGHFTYLDTRNGREVQVNN